MGIDEARQDEATAEVYDPRAGTDEVGQLGRGPDGEDAAAGDRDRLMAAPRGVDRVDLAAGQDHLRGHRASLTPGCRTY